MSLRVEVIQEPNLKELHKDEEDPQQSEDEEDRNERESPLNDNDSVFRQDSNGSPHYDSSDSSIGQDSKPPPSPMEEKARNEDSSSQTNSTEKPEPPRHSLIEVIRNWTYATSVHGVSYVFTLDFYAWKHIAWGIIVTSMATIMIVACAALVQQYLQFNTKTSIMSTSPPLLSFPEVTVCNAHSFQQSKQVMYNITWPKNEVEVNRISQSLSDFMLETQFNNFSYFVRNIRNATALQRMNETVKSQWNPVITPRGRCWSFQTDQMVSVPGQSGGLSFIVDLQQYEYTQHATTAGITFYVAQPGTQIVEQMTGNAASPGGVVAATFEAREVRLETREPWSSCQGQAPEYTQYKCREECNNRARAAACNCRPMGDTQKELEKLDYCGPDDEYCLASQYMAKVEDCDCTKPPCHEAQFPVKTTSGLMSRRFQRSVESLLNVTENYMSTNIVVLTLNYESMVQQVVEETRVQSPYELMASIGGVTGLYMGVSLISIIEVFGELFGLRLLPRLWGDDRLYGIGGRR